MSGHLRVGFYRIMPLIQLKNETICKGILCSLIEYLSKSLKFDYNFDDMSNKISSELFRDNVINIFLEI